MCMLKYENIAITNNNIKKIKKKKFNFNLIGENKKKIFICAV